MNRRFNRGMKSVSEGSAGSGEREEAGKRISRRILTTCWGSLLSQLLTTVGPHLQPVAGRSALAGFLGNSSRKAGGSGFGKGPDVRLVGGIDCLQVRGVTIPLLYGSQSGSTINRKLKIRIWIQGRNHNISTSGHHDTVQHSGAAQSLRTGPGAADGADMPRSDGSAQGREEVEGGRKRAPDSGQNKPR